MPDGQERACPACGRVNAMSARTCEGCGASFVGRLVVVPEAEKRTAYASEFPTVRDGSWQGVALKREQVPLPPQIQAEAFRREQEMSRREAERRATLEKQEALRRDEERRLAEQYRAAAEQVAKAREQQMAEARHAAAQQARQESVARALACGTCGAPAERLQGVRFSFCGNCGADLVSTEDKRVGSAAAPSAAAPTATAAALSQGYMAQQQIEERRVRAEASGTVTAQQMSVAQQQQQQQHQPGHHRTFFSPMFCAASAFFVPGLGQMLNGQGAKGLVLLIAGLLLSANVGIWGVTMVIARLLMALDAYRIADKRRRGETIGNWEWDIQ